jgi:diguanylate cyclase (GGDEF)-like protein
MTDSNPQSDYFPTGGAITKSACFVVFASLVLALAIGGAGLYSVYAPLKKRNEEIFAAALRLSGEQVRDLFESAQSDVMSIARHSELRAATVAVTSQVEDGAASDIRVSELLAEFLAQNPQFDGLLILDLSGAVLANVGSGPAMAGVLDALRRKDVMGGTELLEIMQTKQLQKELRRVDGSLIRALPPGAAPRVVIVASPFSSADGIPVASLLALVRQQEIASRLRAELLGGTGNVLLVDEQGRLVSAGRDSSTVSTGLLAEENPSENDACRSHTDWSADWDGAVKCTFSLGALGWTLVAQQPAHEIFRPIAMMLSAMLLAAVIVAAGLLILSSWLTLAAVRPLGELHRGIVAVAKGDFTTRVSDRRAPSEAVLIIGAFNRLVRRLGERRQEFESSEQALKVQNKSFQKKYQTVSELSVTDPLTKLHNRRFFEEYLDREINRLGRDGDSLCLLVIDIDDFKMLNDSYGHTAGDEFLKQIARIMKENVRETDLIARFGGEEFVIVANGTGVEGAMILAEKVRTSVAESSFIVDDSMRPRRATISIGLAEYAGDQVDLFNKADAALYRAKDSGKNCVVTADA